MKVQSHVEIRYLPFPELSPDFHPVKMPPWVSASVIVSNPDFLYHVTNVFQLKQEHYSYYYIRLCKNQQHDPINDFSYKIHLLTSTINMSSAPLSKYSRRSLLLTHRCFCIVHTPFCPYRTRNTSASVPAANTSLVNILIS